MGHLKHLLGFRDRRTEQGQTDRRVKRGEVVQGWNPTKERRVKKRSVFLEITLRENVHKICMSVYRSICVNT